MYTAKEQGRNRAHLYSEQDAGVGRMHAKIKWEDRIRRAFADNQFILHYQPVFDLRKHQISHYEILLRMQDEEVLS